MSKSLHCLILVCVLVLGSFANAANIVWVSESPDVDGDGVIDDQAYVEWLEGLGHTVDLQRSNWTTMDDAKVEQLNAADLVIFSRSANSGNYDEAGEPDLWNSITAPMIMQSAYLVRNSRWLWFDNATVNNLTAPAYEVVDASHPIFAGLSTEGGQVFLVDETGAGTTSFIGTTASNGNLIAQAGANAAIVEWETGVEFYEGAGQFAGGPRLFFACGTQEVGATPQGGYNLTEDGAKAFLNAIFHMLGGDMSLASFPSPEVGAVDVIRDSSLSWTPGIHAATHNLYFGESFEDVNSASVATAAGLDVNSFDPGHLDFGQTYYWRVDEVNGTPDKTVTKGLVWSFTAEPYSIPIPGSTISVTASSFSNDFSMPEKTADGSGLGADDSHGTSDADMWFTGSPDLDPWIQYEFDDIKKLDTMKVWNSNGPAESAIGWGVKDVQIEYSVDGETWDVLADATQFSRASGLPTYNQYDEIDFGGAAAKVVRFNIQSNWGGILMSYSLSEVQFNVIPVTASTPAPVSGAVDVAPDAVVTWHAGREAAQHTVYVSTDQAEAADGSAPSVTTSTNSLDLSTLDLQLGETYYWRVDEVNEAEAVSVWAGPVWSLSIVDALAVDDFEGYNNVSPDRPFQTWLDGFGYSADEFFPVAYGGNGTGAGIGHDIWSLSSPHYDGDIMETTNTLTGAGQSMPFYYSNSGGVASETQRTFAVPQDWTLGGAQTLSIAFSGQTGNTGTFYVMINNTKVTYQGDIALALWQTWTIDLATVNTNLQSVTKLALGVEGSGAGGMLLIDDITLLADAAGPGGNDGPLVVWVSFHGSDIVPASGAAGAGFTEAPDKAYTDLLADNGYNVIRYVTTNAPSLETLNTADLVIVSRSVASSGYQNEGATAWNSVAAPMIITGGYTTRSSRMGFTTGGTMVDTTGDISLAVNDPSHPIFAGIELSGGTMVNPFAGVVTYPTDGTTVARGISINNDPVSAEGTLLATISDAGNGPVGAMVIAEWQAGATMTHDGGAGTDTLAGHRLVFLTGAREASGVSSETAGLYDLYEDGATMLLNAVDYMLP